MKMLRALASRRHEVTVLQVLAPEEIEFRTKILPFFFDGRRPKTLCSSANIKAALRSSNG